MRFRTLLSTKFINGFRSRGGEPAVKTALSPWPWALSLSAWAVIVYGRPPVCETDVRDRVMVRTRSGV